MKGCLVCLIGLPGSGKTTLANRLEETFSRREGFRVKVLSFDSEIPWTEGWEVGGAWKEMRKSVAEMAGKELTKGDINGKAVVVILDDNNYYRSMRYDYYKIARDITVGFCQVYLQVDKEEAGRRNLQRSGGERVPDEVMERMSQRLEAPRPDRHPWERQSLTLTNWEEEGVESVMQLVENALEEPPPPLAPPTEAPPHPPPSNLHIADLALRSLIRDSDSNCNRQRLNLLRKSILAQVKSGQIHLPETNPPDDLHSTYYNFFSSLLI